MSYDYGYRRCQYDFPQAIQPFRPYQPVQPRHVTCWDPPSSRVEVLRPPSWPDPESPYVSHHLDPADRRPRPRYQPIGYHDRSQDAWPRHRGGYVERGGHQSDRGDHQTELGFDRHPTPAMQRHRPTCWDPPAQQQDRGYLTLDRPRCSETCWDRLHPQEEVRALQVQPASHQPRYSTEQPSRDLYSQPARMTSQTPDQPPRSPTCWDSPEVLHAQPMNQPPRDTPECSNQQRDVAGTVDASSLGFEKIMARFDRLESRWEAIDRRVTKLQASRAAYRQQPQPSHCRAAASPATAAAPPPPLHMDQQRLPSCCHPPTHLRQAEACLEFPPTVKHPLLQRPPSCLHPPSLHSATKLVSCEEKYLGIEGDSKVLNQVDLRLNEKKLVDEEV